MGLTNFDDPEGDWVQGTPKAFGLSDSVDPIPVQMQSHAIRRFFERHPTGGQYLFTVGGDLHSLQEPVVIPRIADGPLIEFRVGPHRIGYFVPELTPSGIVIRTFLFATMAGTPEHEKIRKRLRVNRHGIETMTLDRIESFVFADLNADIEVRKLLIEAGLDHLLEMAADVTVETSGKPKEVAKLIRTYLGRPVSGAAEVRLLERFT